MARWSGPKQVRVPGGYSRYSISSEAKRASRTIEAHAAGPRADPLPLGGLLFWPLYVSVLLTCLFTAVTARTAGGFFGALGAAVAAGLASLARKRRRNQQQSRSAAPGPPPLTEVMRSEAALPTRELMTAAGPCVVELWIGEDAQVHAAVPAGSVPPTYEAVGATQDEALTRLSKLLDVPGVGGARWVPPPTWPAPPSAAWTPPVGWQPDPAWGPAPPGWVFWR